MSEADDPAPQRLDYQDLFDVAPDAVFVAEAATGRLVWANAQAADLVGLPLEEFLGDPITTLHPAGREDQYRQLFESHVDASKNEPIVFTKLRDGTDIYVETAAGAKIPIEINAKIFETGGKDLIVGVFRDISKRKSYEERLQSQREDIEVLNEVVRHDVRSVLQRIQAHVELVTGHVDEDGQDHLDMITRSIDEALDLTADARVIAQSTFQRAESAGGSDVQIVTVHVVDEINGTYPAAKVETEGSLPDVSVVANEMLDAVLRNLLTNAIQHNDKPVPEVTVSGREREDVVELRVADNGPGIAEAQRQAIFEKGEQGATTGGGGLGLYLVETIVEGAGGDVWIEDNEPEGAVVVVELQKATRD